MSDTSSSTRSSWRIIAGITYGLLVAALIAICLTYLIDHFVWGSIHRDESETLVFKTWMGLDLPTIHAGVCVIVGVLLPIAGAVVQVRPLIPRLATLKAFLVAMPFTLIAIATALYVSCKAHSEWFWALHD